MEKILEAVEQERAEEIARHEGRMAELARVEQAARGSNGSAPQASPPQEPAGTPDPPSPPEKKVLPPAKRPMHQGGRSEEKRRRKAVIKKFVGENPGCATSAVINGVGFPVSSTNKLLVELYDEGELNYQGGKKSRRWYTVESVPPESEENAEETMRPEDTLKEDDVPQLDPPTPGSMPNHQGPKTSLEKQIMQELVRQPGQTLAGLGVRLRKKSSELENALAGLCRRNLVERVTTGSALPTFAVVT